MKSIAGDSLLRNFLLIGRAEGASFLLLTLVAMPLKYAAGMPLAVKYVGWAHGVLFMLYLGMLVWVGWKKRWDIMVIILAFVAALLPFGPFLFERWLLRSSHV